MIDDQEMQKLLLSFQATRREMADRFVRNLVLRHNDYVLPERSRLINSLVFIHMAHDFTSGLVGEINRFLIGIAHEDAWSQIAKKRDKSDELALLWEFAEPHLELSVGRPYSIKNQFIFAAVHLLHQSKKLKNPDWIDDLPADHKINYRSLEMADAGWKGFPDFVEKLNKLNDEKFCKNTLNLRHRLQHRFRTQFRFGVTGYFDREKTATGIAYHYKLIPAIPLPILLPELYKQHEAASELFRSYWTLLTELCSEWDRQYLYEGT